MALTAASCRTGDKFEQVPYSLETSTKMAGEIVRGTPGYFGHIKHDKVTNLAQGVSLLDLSCLNMNGYSVQIYLYKIVYLYGLQLPFYTHFSYTFSYIYYTPIQAFCKYNLNLFLQ